MRGISPIVLEVTHLLVYQLKKTFFYNESNNIYITKNSLNYEHSLFEVDKWILNLKDHNSYNHLKSGLNKKKYVVYINLNLENLTVDGLLHEVKHAYVDWCIYKSGGKPIKETREVKRFYTEDFEKLMLNNDLNGIKKLIMFYYFCSKLEIPSFIENHFFDKSYLNYDEKIIEIIDFDFRSLFNSELEMEFFNMKKNYKIPFFNSFFDYNKFLIYSENYLKRRAKIILKKLKKLEKMY